MTQVKEPAVYCTMIVKKMPKALRNAFKGACGLRGITMKDQLEKLMREFVKGGGHKT